MDSSSQGIKLQISQKFADCSATLQQEGKAVSEIRHQVDYLLSGTSNPEASQLAAKLLMLSQNLSGISYKLEQCGKMVPSLKENEECQ